MKLPDIISEEEFVKLIKKVRKQNHRVAFILGFYEGLRVSEVVKLKPEDIRFNEKIIMIKQSKGRKDRHIVMVKPLLMGERTVLSAVKHLPVRCGERALNYALKTYAQRILKKNISFHTLRHSCATWLLTKKRWNVARVQQHLGHSRIDTTMIYTHINPRHQVELEWGEDEINKRD